jgi:hypothetical protein
MMKEKTVSLDYLIGGNKNVLVLFSLFAILLIAIPLISSVSLLNCNIPNTNPLCLTGKTETIAYGGIYFYNTSGTPFTANTSWLTTPAPGIDIQCGYSRNIFCNSTSGILTVLTDSIYEVDHIASIKMGNNVIFESAIAVNGVVQNNTISHLETSAGMRTQLTGFGRIQVFEGDNLSFVYRSPSGSYSGDAYELNYMVKRLGG